MVSMFVLKLLNRLVAADSEVTDQIPDATKEPPPPPHPVYALLIFMHCEAVSSQICCCRSPAAPVSRRAIHKHQRTCPSEVLHARLLTLHPARSDT